jgi:hypothetical protein
LERGGEEGSEEGRRLKGEGRVKGKEEGGEGLKGYVEGV